MKKNKLNYLLVFSFSLLITGCASTKHTVTSGLHHRIEKGETLWRIAKTYNINLDELANINGITDSTKIKAGQIILISKIEQTKKVSSKPFEDFIWPIKGMVIARFGEIVDRMVNRGLDIQAKIGQEILASRSGIVSFCGEELKGYGKTIIIDHGDEFSTVYARNSENLVRTGEKVYQGMVISKIGNTSKNSKSYLHFEIRKGHIPQNPFYYLP